MRKLIMVVGTVYFSLVAGNVSALENTKIIQLAAAKMDSAAHLKKVFKKGSKVCKWTSLVNGVKGTDYLYKDKSATSGSADRVIGNTTLQGTWKITGPAINHNFYGGKKGKGTWYKVKPTGKKSFDLHKGNGAYVMSTTCK